MSEERYTTVTGHTGASGSTFIIPTNGNRELVQIVQKNTPYQKIELYLDSVISGQIVGCSNNYYGEPITLDYKDVGDLAQRRLQGTIVSGSAGVGVIESFRGDSQQ